MAVRSKLKQVGSFAAGVFDLKRGTRMERSERIRSGRQSVEVRMLKSFRVSASVPELELAVTLDATGGPLDALLVVESNLGLPGGVADGTVAGIPLAEPANLGERLEVTLQQPLAGVRYSLRVAKGTRVWYYPIETVNNSEGGYERIVQGACLMAVRAIQLGASPVRLRFRLRSLG
jgi:alpha-amylase